MLLLCGACAAHAAADPVGVQWDSASTAYINGRYKQAVDLYESIRNQGYTGAKLYYNLGNAYFQNGEIGRAILNYNRALVLDPSDADARYNLLIAEARTRDKIGSVPQFFAKRWVVSLWSSMGSNAWAVISVVMFAMCFGAVMLYLLSSKMLWRKTGFYGAIAFVVLFLFTMAAAGRQKRVAVSHDEAVVVVSSVPVKSSPDVRSKDIFVLHEGTKVKVLANLNGCSEIQISDGNKGWLRDDAVELINVR